MFRYILCIFIQLYGNATATSIIINITYIAIRNFSNGEY